MRNSVKPISNKLLEKLPITGIDQVGVNVSEWSDAKWRQVSTSFAEAVEKLQELLSMVDFEVVQDITKVLDFTDEKIANALESIGELIDLVRNNQLLRNEENNSIFEGVLDDYGLTLPGSFVDVDGVSHMLSGYTELLRDYLTTPVIKIKGIYTTLTGESENKIVAIANKINETENENLLKETLLPLYQLDATKKAVFDNGISNISQADFVNFGVLTSYDDWNKDLGYITTVLRGLASSTINDDTYLDLIMQGHLDTVLKSIPKEEIDNIFPSIFYAKSTDGAKAKIISTIKDVLDTLTNPAQSALNINDVTLVEGDDEDQTQEICNILKKFVKVYASYSTMGSPSIKNLNKTDLGALLKAMQTNAYRTQLIEGKEETGLFNGAFINVVNKFKSDYEEEINALINSDPNDKYTTQYFNQTNYANIDFEELLSALPEEDTQTEP